MAEATDAEAGVDAVGKDAKGWERRRLAGASIRVGVTLAPAIVSGAAALFLNARLAPSRTNAGLIPRSLLIVACSMAALFVVDKVLRRMLPLASLLQLTLVFPDQAPSRFRTALKAGSGRRLARAVDSARRDGLSSDPVTAAEQLVVLATAIGDHDRRTRGHSERVRLFAQLLGEQLKLTDDDRAKLQWAALIHDVGKIHVPTRILNKAGKPTPHEWTLLEQHPMQGEELAAPVAAWLGEWYSAIGGHHERYDGTGYPRGLSGKQIPRGAAIVAVADAFEVMTAVRSYKKAMPLTDARAELTRCAGSHFDPAVVRAFLSISIGDTRRAMGLLGALAHLPLIGKVSTAAAFAPEMVPIAGHAVTSVATVGAGAAAITSAVLIAPAGASTAPQGANPAAVVSAPPPDAAPPADVDGPPDAARAVTGQADEVTAATPEPEKPTRVDDARDTSKEAAEQVKKDAEAAKKAYTEAAEQAKKDAEAAKKANTEATEQAKKDAEAQRKAQEAADKQAADQAKKEAEAAKKQQEAEAKGAPKLPKAPKPSD